MSIGTREVVDGDLEDDGVNGREEVAIGIGIPRRTTAEALELITRSETQTLSHSAWYEPGRDFCFYAAAHDACRATKIRLNALDLQEDEIESVNSADGLEVLLHKIQQIYQTQEKASRGHPAAKKVHQFVESFSEFVTRTSGIIELLVPQSPEYRMTYGVLLLVFKTVFKRKETQDSLFAYIHKLSAKLPIVDFYSKVFPTNGMKILVVSIYVEILNLLNEAVVYYQKSHLRQLRDAVLRPVETKFDQCIQRIETEVEKLNDLKNAAHVALQADMKEFLESTGQVVARLYENLNHSMTAFGSCLALLDARIEDITRHSASLNNFQAVNNSLALTEALLPTVPNADEQLSHVRKQHFDLSPKDHWYENGVLGAFESWSAAGRRELLWIGGRSGNRDTWITEMSISLIDALRMQDLTLLHVFCGIAEKRITATSLIKHLIAQLLDRHPEIPFHQPRTYNVQRFRNATTFKSLWVVFEDLVSEITSSVFVLIDRIEDCDADPDLDDGGCEGLSQQLMPFLMGLTSDAKHISVIVTSRYEPPEVLIGGKDMRHFYRDTRRSRGNREG